MIPVYHPLTKTAIDTRRAIYRLELFAEQNPGSELVLNGTIEEIVKGLKHVLACIPKSYRDK